MSDDRQHQPTEKRRRQALDEGRVAASGQLAAAGLWMALAGGGVYFAESIGAASSGVAQRVWAEPIVGGGTQAITSWFQSVAARVGLGLVPILAVLMLLAILIRLAQVGFIWSPQRVVPDFGRLAAAGRSSTFVSGQKMFIALRSSTLLIALLCFAVVQIWQSRDEIATVAFSTSYEVRVLRLIAGWAWQLGLCFAAAALLDYGYQRYRFEAGLRMSDHEIREEIKAVEGNPHVTAERKRLQQGMQRDGHDVVS